MTKTFPTAPEQLTNQWLSQVLGYAVNSHEVTFFSEGAGVMAWVTRILLETSSEHPDSIIAKFPSPVEVNRQIANSYNMYGREVQFYQQIASTLSLTTPKCFFSSFNADDNSFVLLLEDIGYMQIGDQVAGCTAEQAQAVVKAIAKFHASAWQPNQFPNLASHNNPGQIQGMIQGFQAGWPVIVEQFGELIPAAALPAEKLMPAAVEKLLSLMCQSPVCLTHADVRLDNIFFPHPPSNDIALVDWQSICTSAPEQDLAYFVTQSIPASIREQHDWVALYHNTLTNSGVDYSLSQCQERFKVSALYLLCYAVVIAGTLDLGNERGQALGRTLVGNAFSALEEMDAFTLLADMVG